VNGLYMTNTSIVATGGWGFYSRFTYNNTYHVVFDRVQLKGGMRIGGEAATVSVVLRDSSFTSTGGAAVELSRQAGSVKAMIERTALINSGVGLLVTGAGATARLADSTITGNNTGLLAQSGGSIVSFGTNKIYLNNVDGSPTGTFQMR
jgi:hypothetical protein